MENETIEYTRYGAPGILEALMKLVKSLKEKKFSGEIVISFHKGDMSRRVNVKDTISL